MCSCTDRITAAADSSSRRPQSNSARSSASTSAGTDTDPSARNRAISSATAAPSRSSTSNSRRSRLELTWMSIDGDVVGTTSVMAMVPVLKKRVRMSLRFDATTSRSIGRPMRLATHPARMLPKLPVGTTKLTGPPSGATARCAVT